MMNPAINLSLIPRSMLRLISAKVGKPATSMWINAEALWVTKCELEQILLRDLAGSGQDDFDITRALMATEPIRTGDFGKRLAAVREAHAFVTSSPQYIAARDLVEPLLVEATVQARAAGWQRPWEI